MGEHAGRYETLGATLASSGIAVGAYDQPGHGTAPSGPVHVEAWDEYLDALETSVARSPSDLPLFVYGHSMGGLIAFEAALLDRIRPAGWIISAAGIQPGGVARPDRVLLARLLSRIAPRTAVSLGIRPEQLSRDPEVIEAHRNDPLIRHRATVRWGAEALRAIGRIKTSAHRFTAPILILHGGNDPLTRPAGSRWLYETVRSDDRTLRIYEGCLHELHNDLERDAVLNDVAEWILARAGRP